MSRLSPASANALGVPWDQPRSLQAMIELTYVKNANDILYGHMQSLNDFLATTERAVNLLANLQNLHNMVKVTGKGTFDPSMPGQGPFGLPIRVPPSAGAYRSAASAFFNTPILVSADFGPSGFAGFAAAIANVKNQFPSLLILLSASQVLISGREDPNGLLASMRKVFADLNAYNFNNQSGATAWLTDNYNTVNSQGVTSGGKIQQNITTAITAAQSLNTTQTEQVRNYLYLFEEYYKSATAILQQITQAIQKMADNIS